MSKNNCIVAFILALLFVVFSCKESNDGSFKYVYIDKVGILHTKNGCKAVNKMHGGTQPVIPIKRRQITTELLLNICSQCVTEEQLDLLYTLASINEREDAEQEECDTIACDTLEADEEWDYEY